MQCHEPAHPHSLVIAFTASFTDEMCMDFPHMLSYGHFDNNKGEMTTLLSLYSSGADPGFQERGGSYV